jgi:hypothetical protein
VCNFPYYFSAAVTDYQHLQNKPSSPERKPLPSIRCAGFVWRSRGGAMAGGSIRAAAMVGGYRSATAVRRAVLPSSSQPPHSSSAADGRRASTIAMDDWVIPDCEAFDAVPTHEEAMEATLDLRDAFEMCVQLRLLAFLLLLLLPVSAVLICLKYNHWGGSD